MITQIRSCEQFCTSKGALKRCTFMNLWFNASSVSGFIPITTTTTLHRERPDNKAQKTSILSRLNLSV